MPLKINNALRRSLGRLLPKSGFAHGASILVGGTAGAQLLLAAAYPLLTRVYTPEDFGLLAVFSASLSLFLVIASLRYELAIPLPESDEEAANIVVLALMIALAMSAFAVFVVVFFAEGVAHALNSPALEHYLWFLPAGIALGGAYNVLTYWSVRTKQFSKIAETKILQALTTIVIQLGAFKFGSGALILGHVAGQSVGSASLARPALAQSAFRRISLRGTVAAAVRYRRFPLFSTWAGLFNTAGMQLPPLLFAALFGPAVAGFYILANRVLQLPMSLVGQAVGQVFFASAAQARREGGLAPLVAALHARLAHIGLPPALLLMLLGPALFAFVFGTEWALAGEFARWMAPWLYFVFVSSPLSTLFAVMERQGQGLVFQFILLASRVAAILYGALQDDLMLSIMLFAAGSAICWVGFLFWIMTLSGNSVAAIFGPTMQAAGFALASASPTLAVLVIEPPWEHAWLAALAASAGLIGLRYWILLREVY